MGLIVQKFGGTSLADTEKILAAARKAIRAQQDGRQVVMVVSAMGKNTDMLVDLARQISDNPPAREMDMLLSTGEQVSVALMAIAIEALGARGVSLTGAQIGIKTDNTHTKARIRSISTDRVRRLLEGGRIVIAAGFQGIDEDYNITTLGRGGSDTTAVALAAVLQAEACEIYTDVDGVYTTDPRVLPEARCMARISYDEMLELASLGAGVMHSRSIEFAKKYSVPIHVRNSFSDGPGTVISAAPETAACGVCGATLTPDEARVSVAGVPDVPGTSCEVFSRVAERNIAVDMIVQNVGRQGRATISFTVPRHELPITLDAVQEAACHLGRVDISSDEGVSKVSVVGLGMAHQSGVADRMFRALADANINLQMITTSEIKISALVARDQGLAALRSVHRAFDLDKPLPGDTTQPTPRQTTQLRDVAGFLHRLHDLELDELFIDGIELDPGQARVTVGGVPDQPGVAARIFAEVAAAGVFVDMIVQSAAQDGRASLSFTVAKDRVAESQRAVAKVAPLFPGTTVTSEAQIAKLSVFGIGLRSHTGVAVRMFRALAERGINVEMINTSEVSVNVVVNSQHAQKGLQAIEQAFADVVR
jgi:aspartate kinase